MSQNAILINLSWRDISLAQAAPIIPIDEHCAFMPFPAPMPVGTQMFAASPHQTQMQYPIRVSSISEGVAAAESAEAKPKGMTLVFKENALATLRQEAQAFQGAHPIASEIAEQAMTSPPSAEKIQSASPYQAETPELVIEITAESGLLDGGEPPVGYEAPGLSHVSGEIHHEVHRSVQDSMRSKDSNYSAEKVIIEQDEQEMAPAPVQTQTDDIQSDAAEESAAIDKHESVVFLADTTSMSIGDETVQVEVSAGNQADEVKAVEEDMAGEDSEGERVADDDSEGDDAGDKKRKTRSRRRRRKK